MKQRFVFLFALSLTAALVFGCGIFSERYEKTETEDRTISAIGKTKLVLENISGKIELNQSTDSGIIRLVARKEISVRKKDLDKPFDEIKIRVDTTGSEIKIEADINTKTRTKFFNFGSMKGPKVDYELYIPAGFQLNLSNVNGDISSGLFDGNIKLELINGDVSIEHFTGLFESEITNGEISMGVDSTTGIDIETINGSVDLTFGENVSANLKVETTNGKIIDENLNLSDVKREKKNLKADLGNNPSSSVSISTVNGRITLKGKGKNWQ
jgi:DUF4097 and DUF4098 domain-containing protein YvlB